MINFTYKYEHNFEKFPSLLTGAEKIQQRLLAVLPQCLGAWQAHIF